MAELKEPKMYDKKLKKRVIKRYVKGQEKKQTRMLSEMKEFEQKVYKEKNYVKEMLKNKILELKLQIMEDKTSVENRILIKTLILEREIFEERLEQERVRIVICEQEELKLQREKLDSEIKLLQTLVEIEKYRQTESDVFIKIIAEKNEKLDAKILEKREVYQQLGKMSYEKNIASAMKSTGSSEEDEIPNVEEKNPDIADSLTFVSSEEEEFSMTSEESKVQEEKSAEEEVFLTTSTPKKNPEYGGKLGEDFTFGNISDITTSSARGQGEQELPPTAGTSSLEQESSAQSIDEGSDSYTLEGNDTEDKSPCALF